MFEQGPPYHHFMMFYLLFCQIKKKNYMSYYTLTLFFMFNQTSVSFMGKIISAITLYGTLVL